MEEDGTGQRRWCVTLESFGGALQRHLDRINETLDSDQSFTTRGLGPLDSSRPAGIVTLLDGPPPVEVSLGVVPDGAQACAHVQVTNSDDEEIWNLPAPTTRYPHRGVVTAGEYRLSARIEPETPPYIPPNRRAVQARPPRSIWTLPIQQA